MITATARFLNRLSATARMVSRQTGSCAAANVHNSNNTFDEDIASGGSLELEDTDINVYVNGILNQSTTAPAMIDLNININ